MTTHAELAQITATRCVVCHLPLTDADSVERGMGETCQSHYYNPLHEPSEEQVMDALGLMAVSDLPDHITTAFLKVVNNDRANARKGSNLLVYWASCKYDNREEVFKCTAVIRALGYTELADKLETDRTEAVIYVCGDHIEAFTSEKGHMSKVILEIPGVKELEEEITRLTGEIYTERIKKGHKVGWWVPLAEQAHFECVLGLYYGGKLMCGTNGIRSIARKDWSDLRVFRPIKPVAPAPVNLQLPLPGTIVLDSGDLRIFRKPDGALQVFAPYHTDYLLDLKLLIPYRNRKWDPANKCWEVSPDFLKTIVKLMNKYFRLGRTLEN